VGRALDVLGVYILPLCCIAVDYAFLNLWWTELYPLTLLAFAASGMIAFAWASRLTSSHKAAGIGAGALLTGGFGAGLIGLFTAGPGLFALFVAIGSAFEADPLQVAGLVGLALLAFVPLLTAQRAFRRGRALLRGAHPSPPSLLLGAAVIILPTGLALLIEISGDQRREADLRSGERDRVLRALSPDSRYSPRDIVGRPSWSYALICRNLSTLPLDDPAVESAARKALRTEPDKKVHQDCGKAP
jgi:hypothetical protein